MNIKQIGTVLVVVFLAFSSFSTASYIAVAPVLNLSTSVQSGTSYVVVSANRSTTVVLTNAGSKAVTIPAAGSVGFESGFWTIVKNEGAGNATVTPATSTIGGSATLTIPQGTASMISSDGANYQIPLSGSGLLTPGSGISLTRSAHGLLIDVATSVLTTTNTAAVSGKTFADPNLGAGPSAVTIEIPNAGVTGTTLNRLAKLSGAPSTAVIATTLDTVGVIGVVISGAGTTGNARVARAGIAPCAFDGATTANNYVIVSSTVGGACRDAGPTPPLTGMIGRVLQSVVSGNANVLLF